MVTPRTGNPKGRPPKIYREDPDRFAIAFALAAQEVWQMTEASSFELAAALSYGERDDQEAKGRRRLPPGWVKLERT